MNAALPNRLVRRLSFARIWGSATLFAAFFFLSSSQAATVTAQLERSTIMAGETVTLSVAVEGGRPQTAETFPAMDGVSVQYQGNSPNFTSVNGQTSFKHILNYAVSGTKPGEYTLPSINITVDGASLKTQPVRLTVAKADPSTFNRYAFLRLNVPKEEVYVGEIFPVELQLYVVNAENPQQPQLKGEGFVIHKRLDPTQSQAQIGNVLYTVLTFKMSVSAAKAGKLPLGPAEMGLTLKIRSQSDPGGFFGAFGRFERRPVTLTSAAPELNVLPLPSPAPPEFSGGIGEFRWTVDSSPSAVTAGDPITLRVAIAGRGNLDNLKLPALNWTGFKLYEATVSAAPTDVLGIEGTKSFEQVVVPQDASITEIPTLKLSYFDPAAKSYKTLTHSPVPIQVSPAAASRVIGSAARPQSEQDEEPPAPDDIVHIKSSPGPILALAPPMVRQPWFLFLQLIPLAGVIGATIWRRRQDNLARNPKLRRKMELQRTIQSGLAELRHQAAHKQPDAFYALLFRLLQEQLGERLDLPAAAITEAVLDDRLPRRGASPHLIERLRHLFQVANQARFAPTRTDAELLSLSSDLEKALRDLQQLPD